MKLDIRIREPDKRVPTLDGVKPGQFFWFTSPDTKSPSLKLRTLSGWVSVANGVPETAAGCWDHTVHVPTSVTLDIVR